MSKFQWKFKLTSETIVTPSQEKVVTYSKKDGCHVTLLWLWSLFLVHQKKTLWFNFKNYFDFVFCKTIKPLCFSCTYSWLILVRNSLTDQISFMVRTNYKTRKNVYILLKFLAWKVLPVHFRDTHVLVYSV